MEYYIYILENQEGDFYKGITTDIEKHLAQHNDSNKSKYTSSRSLWILLGIKKMADKRSTLIEERNIYSYCKKHLIYLIFNTYQNYFTYVCKYF